MHISNCTFENQLFMCEDESNCIELKKTCSGHPECIDGSDEGGMCLQAGNMILTSIHISVLHYNIVCVKKWIS